MEDYVLSLQGRDDVGSLLTATHESEERLLRNYKESRPHTHSTTERISTTTSTTQEPMETSTTEEVVEVKEIIREQVIYFVYCLLSWFDKCFKSDNISTTRSVSS
jgi:hypothetical protein